MKKIIYFLFFIIINQLIAKPNPAIMIFNGGSAFEGYADINQENKIEFRLELTDNIEIFDGFDIKRIEFNEEPFSIYEYHYINNKYILLEVISEGEIKALRRDIFSYSTKKTSKQLTKEYKRRTASGSSFYNISSDGSYSSYYSSSDDSGFVVGSLKKIKYYLKKDSEPIVNIKNNLKKESKYYFKDCPGLLKKIKSKEFIYTDLKLIVDYYNDFCTEL